MAVKSIDKRTGFEKMKGDYDGAVLSLLRLSDILIEGMHSVRRNGKFALSQDYATELISEAQMFCHNALQWIDSILTEPSNFLDLLTTEQKNELRRCLKEDYKEDEPTKEDEP